MGFGLTGDLFPLQSSNAGMGPMREDFFLSQSAQALMGSVRESHSSSYLPVFPSFGPVLEKKKTIIRSYDSST